VLRTRSAPGAYEDVCTDKMGHAEVVQVEYDPAQAAYNELLKVFWGFAKPIEMLRSFCWPRYV